MPKANLTLYSQVVAYGDIAQTNNPSLKNVDWNKQIANIPIKNPKADGYTIDPLATLTVFNGTRSTAIDGTTEFLLSLSAITGATNRYRFAWTATGTNPAFRTDRGLTLNTHVITITINSNSTISFASANAGDFTAVQVGDIFFIPGTTTGDSSGPFNPANEGEWSVLGKDSGSQTLTLARMDGVSFSAYGEVVTVASNNDAIAYSATGVQVGDKVTISAGFPASVQATFEVAHVRPTLFEVYATQALPVNVTAVPTASGMVFYTQGKKYVRVDADQECVVRANGSAGDTERISPWYAGDMMQSGEYTRTGPTWQLVIVNKTSLPLEVNIITAE